VEIEKMFVKAFLVAFFVGSALARDYCDKSFCSFGPNYLGPHVACKDQGFLDWASTCSADRRLLPVSQSDKDLIIDLHNSYRNKIATGSESPYPSAVRMTSMVSCCL